MPPQKMLERLSNRLKLLKGGARDLPTRQQTLRGAIDWSYELLEEDEKTLFGRLSVFSGGRTLEAIEEICDPEGDLDALDGVESLLEKSLLRQEVGPGGEPRFVMLETVHEYAREKLGESGEAEVMRGAHAEYFLALAKDAEPALKGPEQLEWLERLEAEHDNLRAALGWALESKDGELALRLARCGGSGSYMATSEKAERGLRRPWQRVQRCRRHPRYERKPSPEPEDYRLKWASWSGRGRYWRRACSCSERQGTKLGLRRRLTTWASQRPLVESSRRRSLSSRRA